MTLIGHIFSSEIFLHCTQGWIADLVQTGRHCFWRQHALAGDARRSLFDWIAVCSWCAGL